MFGFLNIYKPVGMTSHDVVSVLRRVTKIKQIGHTGTLDPFAEGVLPICIGKATRLIEYLEDDKAYIGTFNFGKSTTTYDIEGDTVETFTEKITEKQIKEVLNNFEGEIEQIPPIYSAIKVNGKKLYDYAREGKEVKIKSRKVFIEAIELKNFDYNNQIADIYIKCSKGTYIRSIANDLGKILNNGAYLSKLQRIQAGRFLIENAIKLDDFKSVTDVEKNLINPIDYLPQAKQKLNEVEFSRMKNGLPIYNRIKAEEGFVLLIKENNVIGISEVTEDGLKIKKVFISN
ncbi:MAG: tRNA pseudouridine(55) synthase TruB [Candidatus Gastranaerophilales bacterium]|nr:tRNA pseudouridine(55) synthase TruB [Candidatus Gastranaerophilales bacterium]